MSTPRLVAGCALVSGLVAGFAPGQELVAVPGAKILEPHPTSLFGFDVALSGDTAAVGAPADDTMAQSAGAVAVLERGAGGWAVADTLYSSDPQPVAQFGSAVAIDGDTIAVGSPYRDDRDLGNGTGAVHVFVRSGGTWAFQALIEADGRRAGDNFGSSLALQGDRLAVGAPHTDDLGFDSGSTYVFERSAGTWSEVARLHASDAGEGAELGEAIALSGATLVVGAPQVAAAYVFVQGTGGWQEEWILSAAVPPSSRFGGSVDVQGDLAIVGARGVDAAFVFGRSGSAWTELQRVEPSSAAGDYFGVDVALEDERLVVSAMLDDDAGPNAGAVYAFAREATGGWTEQQKLSPPGVDAQDLFGHSLAFADGTALVTATGPPGAVHEVEVRETMGTRFCAAVPNSTGAPGQLSVAGSAIVTADDLVLVATHLPRAPNLGYFLMGSGTSTFTPPGSAGPICVAPGLQRYLPPPANTSQLRGGFFRTIGTHGRVSGSITAGSTWAFQAWHRDGANPSNLTDAVRVAFQ